MSHFRGVAVVLVLTMGSALLISARWKPAPPPRFTGLSSSEVPLTLAGFTATSDIPPSRYIQNALPGADILDRHYILGTDTMDFTLISGTQGVELHDPRLCMGSLLLSAPRSEHLAGTPINMQVYHASSKPGQPPDMLVGYFYLENGRVISSPSAIRASLLIGDLLGRPDTPVYFFRFIQPLQPGSDAYLRQFATQAWRTLSPKINAANEKSA